MSFKSRNFISISSEESGEIPDEGMDGHITHDYLAPNTDSLNRPARHERRLSRAPEEPAGRIGVWHVSDVIRDLRSMNEQFWELVLEGNETKILENVLQTDVATTNAVLLMSSWHGLTEITKHLLLCGASPNICDPKGRSPLHLACCANAEDCVELLLHSGAEVLVWDKSHKVTPLHCAAAAPSLSCVKKLLKAGADPDAGLGGISRSALHLAVQAGNSEIVELLLDAGATANTTQLYTETPLHVAAALGLPECVKLLLKHGADVRVQVGPGRATPLHLAAEDGNADCARMLLDAGADPQARNVRLQTPLHLAALAQSAETLELLLHRNANPNSIDASGRTPLHSAIVKGSRSCECVRLLVEQGADINKADNYGYTPLHIAALSEFSACVELLIRHGGHVTARTKGGVSALSFMVRRTPDALQRFLDKLDSSITLHEHELGDMDCTLKLDFRVLVPRASHGESELLLSFIEVGQKQLLQHPLCQTFLHLKWIHIRKFFIFSLLFHAIFVILHTSYIMAVFLDPGPPVGRLPPFTEFLGYSLLFLNICLVAKEIFQIFHAKYKYTHRWENWLQWFIIISVFGCVESILPNTRRPLGSWQHHAAAYSIFFTWVELMMLIGRFPIFGLYVQMFTTVAANFAKFLFAYSCLLVAFALSFAVLFPKYESFKTVGWSLLKTLIMMIGELEFENIFFNDKQSVIYTGSAHLFFFVFSLLASVVLMNLLVGLAVSDIQGLQRSAGLDRLVREAELVAHIESLVFSKLCTNCIPIKLVRFCHRSASLITSNYRWAFYIRPNDPRETRIPKELVEACYQLVVSRSPKGRKMRDNGIRNVSQYSACSSIQPYIDNSVIEQIRNQLSSLISRSEQSSNTDAVLSQRLTTLAIQVEALRREITDLSSKAALADIQRICTSVPNINTMEKKITNTNIEEDIL